MEQKKIRWLLVSLWVYALLFGFSSGFSVVWLSSLTLPVVVTFIVTYKGTRW